MFRMVSGVDFLVFLFTFTIRFLRNRSSGKRVAGFTTLKNGSTYCLLWVHQQEKTWLKNLSLSIVANWRIETADQLTMLEILIFATSPIYSTNLFLEMQEGDDVSFNLVMPNMKDWGWLTPNGQDWPEISFKNKTWRNTTMLCPPAWRRMPHQLWTP